MTRHRGRIPAVALGLIVATATLVNTVLTAQLARERGAGYDAGKLRGELEVLRLEGVARKVWQEQHDSLTVPLIREHVAFFAAWPGWQDKTELIYRYVIRHATLEELQSLEVPDVDRPAVPGLPTANRRRAPARPPTP